MPRKPPPKLRPRYDLGPSSDWPFDLQPTSALDIEIMEAAKSRIDAMDHDFGRLAKRLRKEAGRKHDGRDILADVLESKRQRPDHRPKHIRVELAQRVVADFVRVAKQAGVPWPEIIKHAKERFNISDRAREIQHKTFRTEVRLTPSKIRAPPVSTNG
jgi:hypothetical protein